MTTRLRFLPHVWAVLLVLLLLGPALGPGFVLSYDLVWVPDLAMRSDFLGLGTALPRAVPSDAVVAALDQVLPGMLLEKVALAAPLLAAALGMVRMVGPSLIARVVVVTLTVWNPFVVERLWIGHWTVLVGYGVLPWLVLAGLRSRTAGRVPWSVWLLLPLGSLSASAGLVSTAALLVTGTTLADRAGRLRTLRLAGLCLAANGPWLVAGIMNAGSAVRTEASAVFALHGEGSLPAPLAALSLGGIWNSQVVPTSRQTFLSWVSLAVLLTLAALGARVWRGRQPAGQAARLVILWVLGMTAAVLTWLTPGLTAWLAREVPGGGLLRDGTRSLALCLPLWAGVPATGAEVLARTAGARDRMLRALVGAVCAVVPVALLYDAAWGLSGALRPVSFPPSWVEARDKVETGRGDVLLLPFTAYRAPDWNGGRTVLDPLGRYLRPDYLMNDSLLVDGRFIRGEDPRARSAARALRLPDPGDRATALRALGIGAVASAPDAGAPIPSVDGATVLETPTIRVQTLSGPVSDLATRGGAARTALVLAWLAFVAGPMAGCVEALVTAIRGRRHVR